jgi:hypothetical protein
MRLRVKLLIVLLPIVAVISSIALITISSPLKNSSYEQQLNANALPDETNVTAPILFYTTKINGVSNRVINYTVVLVNPNNVSVVYGDSVNVTLIFGDTRIYSRWIAKNWTLLGPNKVPSLGAVNFYTGTINLPPYTSSGVYWLTANTDDAQVSTSTGEILRNRIIAIPTTVTI